MKPRLNPDLVGFRCIRCDTSLPIADYFEGCPACAESGYPVSVTAEYAKGTRVEHGGRLPMLGPSYLGEGDTPLVPLDALAGELGLAGLWAKMESANPTRSHKDRMSRFVVARAQHLGMTKVVAATSGNAGVSLAATAKQAGLDATIIVRRNAPGRWIDAIREHGAQLIESVTPDARWADSRELVLAGTHYPATNFLLPPVGSNPFGVQGYKTVAYELVDALGGQPLDAVVVPTDRGDLLWGIFEGLRELVEQQRIATMPRLFATEPYPRISAVSDGTDYRETFAGQSDQASIGGSTVTWQGLSAVQASGGAAVVVDDRQAESSRQALAGVGVTAELCSAATLGAVRTLVSNGELGPGAHVALIITSDGALATRRSDEVVS